MPNHNRNIVEVSGSLRSLKKLHEQMKDGFDFNKLIPMPEEINKTTSPNNAPESERKALIAKYGYDNWYNWALDNWGTKWNAYEQAEPDLRVESATLTFDFQTAWCMPLEIAQALSETYPDLRIEWKWADEDTAGGNCGIRTFENGSMISEQFGDEDFADNLWGWESEEE